MISGQYRYLSYLRKKHITLSGAYDMHYLLFSGIGVLLCHHPYCFPSQSQSLFGIGAGRPVQTRLELTLPNSTTVYIRISVATIYDAQHREIGVSRNTGTRKKEDGDGGGEEFSPSFLPALTLPNSFLPDFFLNMAVTRAERFGHSKKTHENVNFDLFLYSVQAHLSFSGESSYSINMSGGLASIGDHSVTNVGTATPR